jgi:hypothetical protein
MAELSDMKEKGASYIHNDAGLGLSIDTAVLNMMDKAKKQEVKYGGNINCNSSKQAQDLFSLPFLFSSGNNEIELKEFVTKRLLNICRSYVLRRYHPVLRLCRCLLKTFMNLGQLPFTVLYLASLALLHLS